MTGRNMPTRTLRRPAQICIADHASARSTSAEALDHSSELVKDRGYGADLSGSRFLEVDPVEGGCANDYTYVRGDPINSSDLSGMADCRSIFRLIRRAMFGDSYGATGHTGMKGVISRWVKQKRKMTKDRGHKTAYEQDRRYLRDRIKEWDDNDCHDGNGPGRGITVNQMSYVGYARRWSTKAYPWPSHAFQIGPFKITPIIS